jgi:pantetheine-phosphate adenylyltransferase
MREKNAVYAGSFDPVHNGHMFVIKEGSKLFDNLFVVIGNNTTKNHLFSKDEREEFVSELMVYYPNIFVSTLLENELTADFANKNRCDYMLRGLRDSQDLIYESSIQFVNSQLYPDIQTIFLNTPMEFQYISSSVIRELLKLKKYDLLKEKYIYPTICEKVIEAWEKKNGK